MKHPTTPLFVFALASAPASALAQDTGAEAEQPGATPGGVTVIQVPAAPPPQVIVPGLPQPGFDPNAHLPSSSRATTDTARPSDGFDLLPKSDAPVSVRGNPGGSYVVEGQYLPEAHSVRRGDTLWDISGRYYQNPYAWPQLWAMNPQLQNPHWIYPGDRLTLRDQGDGSTRSSLVSGNGAGLGQKGGSRVPPQTVFLRTVGWIDDQGKDTWGTVVGSPEDQMMLSEGDDVYLRLFQDEEGEDRPIAVGQELTIFQPIKRLGSGKSSGDLVSVRGTVRVDRYNPKTRMVRGRIVESLDVIERGAKVGAVLRRFDVVPPRQSDKDIEAHLLASVYPNQIFGQHQVVFIDKGKEEGVEPGMRFFAVRRGDRWAQSIDSAGPMAKLRPRVEDDRAAVVDKMQYGVDEDLLPDETYAELRVLSVRDHTAAALVTVAVHEIERGAVLVARKGF